MRRLAKIIITIPYKMNPGRGAGGGGGDTPSRGMTNPYLKLFQL